ncbi:MAG: hypothetical protein U1F16_08110 [Turneriella sp.]
MLFRHVFFEAREDCALRNPHGPIIPKEFIGNTENILRDFMSHVTTIAHLTTKIRVILLAALTIGAPVAANEEFDLTSDQLEQSRTQNEPVLLFTVTTSTRCARQKNRAL